MDFGINLIKSFQQIQNAQNPHETLRAIGGYVSTTLSGAESFAATVASTVNVFFGDLDKKWTTAHEVLERVQRGDLIQFRRAGDIYTHFAVYVGNGYIVHVVGDKELSVIFFIRS
jgi:cell wall-associated NlpC family hydrolase